jgi:hypothetical protein
MAQHPQDSFADPIHVWLSVHCLTRHKASCLGNHCCSTDRPTHIHMSTVRALTIQRAMMTDDSLDIAKLLRFIHAGGGRKIDPSRQQQQRLTELKGVRQQTSCLLFHSHRSLHQDPPKLLFIHHQQRQQS